MTGFRSSWLQPFLLSFGGFRLNIRLLPFWSFWLRIFFNFPSFGRSWFRSFRVWFILWYICLFNRLKWYTGLFTKILICLDLSSKILIQTFYNKIFRSKSYLRFFHSKFSKIGGNFPLPWCSWLFIKFFEHRFNLKKQQRIFSFKSSYM